MLREKMRKNIVTGLIGTSAFLGVCTITAGATAGVIALGLGIGGYVGAFIGIPGFVGSLAVGGLGITVTVFGTFNKLI